MLCQSLNNQTRYSQFGYSEEGFKDKVDLDLDRALFGLFVKKALGPFDDRAIRAWKRYRPALRQVSSMWPGSTNSVLSRAKVKVCVYSTWIAVLVQKRATY